MHLLFVFALSWALWRGLQHVGHDTRTGVTRVYRDFRDHGRRQAAARAAYIRRRGTPTQKAALWAGATGVVATRTAGRGLLATGRGAYRAGRSFHTGWRAGWAEGKTRHTHYVQRRTGQTTRGHAASGADRSVGRTADLHDGLADSGVGRDGPTITSSGQITDAAPGSATKTPGQPAGDAMQAQPEQGGTPVSVPTTGEAPNIEAARDALKAIADQAEETNTTIDQLSASLTSADMDPDTLGEVSEILEAADNLKTAAANALAGLDNRHQVMEEAVNSTPHAAKTEFYRH